MKETVQMKEPARLAAAAAAGAVRGQVDLVRWCCGAVIVLVSLTMIGWLLHVPILTTVLPHYASMKPNTAAGLGLLAVACWMRRRTDPGEVAWPGPASLAAIAFTFMLSVGTLLEDIFHTSGWLDGIILQVPASRAGEPPSGRMAVGTAVCLTLTALGLLASDRLPRLSVWLFGLVGGTALSALVGIVFNAGPLFGVSWLRSLALNTAVGLLLLAIASLAARPEREPVRSLFAQAQRQGRTSWLLVGVTVLPLLVAIPLLLAMRWGLADAGFAMGMMVVLLTAIQTTILWRDSVTLGKLEERRMKAEQALMQNEKLAVVGRLAASIAHEINNPLEAVGTLAYLIQGAESLEEAGKYARMAQEELLRVTQITSQTLNFYRQSRNQASCEPVGILDSALGLLKGKIMASGVSVTREFEDGLGAVNCLEGELRQVFINLVSNALEATPRSGRLIVRVRASRAWKTGAAGVRIVFADTGTGMPLEVRKRIFEPFYTTKVETGNGLGLWVAQELIEKHGGCLRVWSSTLPRASGTVFSVFLPRIEDAVIQG